MSFITTRFIATYFRFEWSKSATRMIHRIATNQYNLELKKDILEQRRKLKDIYLIF